MIGDIITADCDIVNCIELLCHQGVIADDEDVLERNRIGDCDTVVVAVGSSLEQYLAGGCIVRNLGFEKLSLKLRVV